MQYLDNEVSPFGRGINARKRKQQPYMFYKYLIKQRK